MTTSEDPRIRALRGVSDPVARARDAQRFIDRGEELIGQAREIRDNAIRDAKANGNYTRETLADLIGTTINVVITALRGTKRRRSK